MPFGRNELLRVPYEIGELAFEKEQQEQAVINQARIQNLGDTMTRLAIDEIPDMNNGITLEPLRKRRPQNQFIAEFDLREQYPISRLRLQLRTDRTWVSYKLGASLEPEGGPDFEEVKDFPEFSTNTSPFLAGACSDSHIFIRAQDGNKPAKWNEAVEWQSSEYRTIKSIGKLFIKKMSKFREIE